MNRHVKTYVAPRPAKHHRGMTLVELLVVILIMLMITALTIPMIAPAMSGRQVREAARAIDVFVNGARSRAMQSDLGFGVMIQRDANIPQMSTTLVYCEQPPNYAGDYQTSTIRMLGNGGFGAWQTYIPLPTPPTGTYVVDSSPVFPQSDIGWINNVGPGDTFFLHDSNLTLYRLYSGEPYIDVNGNGTFDPGEPFNDVDGSGVSAGGLPAGVGYTPPMLALDANGCFTTVPIPVVWGTASATITYSFADPLLAAQCMSSTGLSPISLLPFWVDTNPAVSTSAVFSGWSTDPGGIPGTSTGLAFQFERRPVISAAPPLELPEGTCIDLGGTWLDPSGVQVPIIGSGMDVPASMLTSGGAGTLVSMATFRPNPALDPAVTATPASVDQSPIIIMFLPDGRLKSVYSWYENNFTIPLGWQARAPVSPIYLLVGRVDLMGGDGVTARIGDPDLVGNLKTGAAPLAPIFNLQDTNSLWVSIGNSTGRVGVVENAGFDNIPGITLRDPIFTPPYTSSQLQGYLNEQAYFARRLAREQADVGGR